MPGVRIPCSRSSMRTLTLSSPSLRMRGLAFLMKRGSSITSPAGSRVTDESSLVVLWDLMSKALMAVISSPNMSRRTGASMAGEKISMMEPRTLNWPTSSIRASLVYPMPTRRVERSSRLTSVPALRGMTASRSSSLGTVYPTRARRGATMTAGFDVVREYSVAILRAMISREGLSSW
ncbi:MAG: hypothetical protein BWX71_01733 [Deltaproteobacteria bacterium ADurb.Bin072]|nr:MAG: hypothetical protein BWX71_01733 [Deltaproteobacteria bacterium ADurb.Bin072]